MKRALKVLGNHHVKLGFQQYDKPFLGSGRPPHTTEVPAC
jgi:hypothetical protein